MAKILFKHHRIIKLILALTLEMVLIGQQAQALTLSEKERTHANVASKTHSQEVVILIHGLMRTSLSMLPLKSYLERKGYHVLSYSYPSTRYTIQQHGVYLQQFINNLIVENPDIRINFITHSLGGIITREALSKFKPAQLKHVGGLIMLAPPNQGSKLARLSTKIFPIFTSPIKPLAELSSDHSSYVHHVPVPHIKIAIIAGRYDAKVPPEYARLAGQREPMIIDSNHTFIMNNSKTRELIINFLKYGTLEMPVKKKL